MVAAAPFFVTAVLPVTLNTRDSFLPAIVKVLALASTAETVPRNGTARGALAAGEAAVVALAEAVGEALGLGEGLAFFEAAEAWLLSATTTMHTPAVR